MSRRAEFEGAWDLVHLTYEPQNDVRAQLI